MRANGVPERFCTGDADPYEKFLAWAGTVPHTLRNPLYHWTHLELKRYFGIDDLLDEHSAPAIWETANAELRRDELSVRGILRHFRVQVQCTTDDPADSLEHHSAIAAADFSTRVLPTFRPDRVLATADVAAFNAWIDRLGAAARTRIATLDDLLAALAQRHEDFHQLGCRFSDHGLRACPEHYGTAVEAA